MSAKDKVAQMNLEEKAGLCSGLDFWHTKSVERLNLPSVMVTDGPHGLRKQHSDADNLGIYDSVPSTCFPAASTTSNSFDRDLLHEIGTALGEECQQEEVSVLLGPAINIKRSPLCGRNFEYVSEDPFVAGELASALIDGIQSQDRGVSVKHYAANNQEKRRMVSNSVVDERALREIYLTAYETVVKKSQPWTFMCSYNKVNGQYASENKKLLTEILRDEWGFKGIVMTDWGATNDRVLGLAAGLDLEMPASNGYNDAKIVSAVKDGSLAEDILDTAAERLTELIEKSVSGQKKDFHYDAEAHDLLARKAAASSAVLLKNEGDLLPLKSGTKIAVIGEMAKKPRFQGAGSSRINPIKLDNAHDELLSLGLDITYAPGYILDGKNATDEKLIAEAAKVAASADVVLLFIGLPDEYESEGFDRTTLDIPESHTKLIEAVAAANANAAVVIQTGAPIRTPWADKVKSILLAYLGGQAGGGAVADIITGKVNPSGKLAESYPLSIEDTPCNGHFAGDGSTEEYRESIYVGYRFYDTAALDVAWPFGYGLSYTSFEYSGLTVDRTSFDPESGSLKASVQVKNTGDVAGAEIVQLYIAPPSESVVFRSVHELKGFEKVYLKPSESKTVEFVLDRRSFAYYNVPAAGWAVEGGLYTLQIGASSRDIRLTAALTVAGDGKESLLADLKEKVPAYYNLPKGRLNIPEGQFEIIYGEPLPPSSGSAKPYTVNSTLGDIKDTSIGKSILKAVQKEAAKMLGTADGEPNDLAAMLGAMLLDMPLRGLATMGGGDALTPAKLNGLLALMNHRYFKAIGFFLKK